MQVPYHEGGYCRRLRRENQTLYRTNTNVVTVFWTLIADSVMSRQWNLGQYGILVKNSPNGSLVSSCGSTFRRDRVYLLLYMDIVDEFHIMINRVKVRALSMTTVFERAVKQYGTHITMNNCIKYHFLLLTLFCILISILRYFFSLLMLLAMLFSIPRYFFSLQMLFAMVFSILKLVLSQ